MTKGRGRLSRQWPISILILVIGAVLIYANLHKKHPHEEEVRLELKPIQIPGGWGYLVLEDGKVFIRQTIIPAIGGAHPFRTREDALAVGQKVVDRLSAGEVPAVTATELNAMGIRPDQPPVDSAQRK
jgi:hypothetical protein